MLKLLKLIRWDWIAFAWLVGALAGVLHTAWRGEATFQHVVLGVAAAFSAGLYVALAAFDRAHRRLWQEAARGGNDC